MRNENMINDEVKAISKDKNEDLKSDSFYLWLQQLAHVMDKWGLDPILSFIFPIGGDLLTSLMTLPYVYFALVRLHSFPLVLAIVCNMLIDILIGSFIFGIGDILDIFYRSYVKNCCLIKGFVEGDTEIINEVKRRAWFVGILIILLLVLVGVIVWMHVATIFALYDFICLIL